MWISEMSKLQPKYAGASTKIFDRLILANNCSKLKSDPVPETQWASSSAKGGVPDDKSPDNTEILTVGG